MPPSWSMLLHMGMAFLRLIPIAAFVLVVVLMPTLRRTPILVVAAAILALLGVLDVVVWGAVAVHIGHLRTGMMAVQWLHVPARVLLGIGFLLLVRRVQSTEQAARVIETPARGGGQG